MYRYFATHRTIALAIDLYGSSPSYYHLFSLSLCTDSECQSFFAEVAFLRPRKLTVFPHGSQDVGVS